MQRQCARADQHRAVLTVDAVPPRRQVHVVAARAQHLLRGLNDLARHLLAQRRRLGRIVVAHLIDDDEHVGRQHRHAQRRVGARRVARIDHGTRCYRAAGRPGGHGEEKGESRTAETEQRHRLQSRTAARAAG